MAARRLGLAPSYPTALGALPSLRALLRGPVAQPGAEELARTLITLPTHGGMTEWEMHSAVAAVRRVARQSS
jgi:dTDP-4-amino-4,6-dideoxygalactose transaminase